MWPKKFRLKKSETLSEDGRYTFLGKGVDIKGKAKFEGTVRIDGRLEGEVYTNDTLIIGEHAVLKGSVTADVIICGGKIEANVTGGKRVQLLHPAVLIGDVKTPSFAMEEGVHFQGMCDMNAVSNAASVKQEPQELENVHKLIAHREKIHSSGI